MTSCNRFAAILLALVTPAAVAGADGITFDEIPASNANCCFLSDEYVDLGVMFETTDDGSVWAGMSNGDPGTWNLEGSSGPAFLGFNGTSYSARLLFDAPVTGFSMDVARASGSSGTARIKLTGYLAGVVVSRNAVILAGTNQWLPVTLAGEIDEVEFYTAETSGFRPYGVDNLQFEWAPPDVPAEPEPILVDVDIQPGNEGNQINPESEGVVNLLMVGSPEFGVEEVFADSLAFGPAGALRAHQNGPHYTDANGDGLLDLLVHFNVQEIGLDAAALVDEAVANDPTVDPQVELCLTGETLDGVPLEGCDVATLVTPEPEPPVPPETGEAGDDRDCQDGDGHYDREHHRGHHKGTGRGHHGDRTGRGHH